MQKRVLPFLLFTSFLTFAPAAYGQDKELLKTVQGYLDKIGLRYAPHPKNDNALVVTTRDNEAAERLDLYIEVRKDDTLLLTCYAKSKGRYFNLSRVADKEKLFQRLLEENYAGFATFYIDKQGDIGLRFTFTTENGVGYEAFSTAVNELLRIADQFTPKMEPYMQKPAPATTPPNAKEDPKDKVEKKPEKNRE